MNYMEPMQIMQTLIDCFKYVPDRFSFICEEVSKLDKKQQDILHEIENSKFHVVDGYKLAKQIQEIRHLRRQYKNEVELMNIVKQLVDNNKNLELNMFKTKTTLAKMLERQENPIYTPRIKEGE